MFMCSDTVRNVHVCVALGNVGDNKFLFVLTHFHVNVCFGPAKNTAKKSMCAGYAIVWLMFSSEMGNQGASHNGSRDLTLNKV